MALDESNGDGSSRKRQQPEHFPHGPQATALDPRAAISSVHSRGTSYHHLPVELLACILNMLFPDPGSRSKEDMTEIYRLRLVSKSWKELVEHTPGLWTYISNNFPTVVAQDCLRWSKDRLLWIRIWRTRPSRMENLPEIFDLLRPHSHRWKTLEYFTSLIARSESTHTRKFLESPAPMLQSIEVTLSEFDEKPGLNLAGGVAKELKHVTLRDAILPEYSNLLHGLETFSLKNNGTVPTREVLNIFIKNPALRRFELFCEGAEGESDPSAASAMQQLKTVATSLERVIILTDQPQIITQILSRVSMPNCKHLELSVLDGDFRITDQALAQFMPRIREALSFGGRTRLSVESEDHYGWSNLLEDEGFQFSFEWTDISLESLREWIRGFIGPVESPPKLEIILYTSHRDIVATLGEWNEFDVTKLTIMLIDASSEEMDEVVSLPGFLGDVMVDSIGALSWRFPNLRELDLSFAECDLSEVFGMLNKRYLPDTYVREMEGLGISIQTPPQIDLRVQNTTEVEDAALITALQRHWGVKSLQQGEPDA